METLYSSGKCQFWFVWAIQFPSLWWIENIHLFFHGKIIKDILIIYSRTWKLEALFLNPSHFTFSLYWKQTTSVAYDFFCFCNPLKVVITESEFCTVCCWLEKTIYMSSGNIIKVTGQKYVSINMRFFSWLNNILLYVYTRF